MNATHQAPAGKEPKVSAAQARLLAAAAAHPEGLVQPAAKATERVGQSRTAEALAMLGLIRQLPRSGENGSAFDAFSPGPGAWTITAAGLRAIGAPDIMLGGSPPGAPEDDLGGAAAEDCRPAEGAVEPAVEQPKRTEEKSAQHASGGSTKAELILGLLKRAEGASLDKLTGASGWQAHSVRGFLSATVRKRLGLTLTSETDEAGVRRYRIEG